MNLQYQIGINLISGISDINGKKLIAYCGGAEAVFKEKKSNLLKIPGLGVATANKILNTEVLKRADLEVEFIQKNKIKTFYFLDDDYPERLKHCLDGPIMLYYKGNANLDAKKIIGIVGTRKASNYGISICKSIIEGLKDLDILVVSGLAYGIDTMSHKQSLAQGLKTIGVLAHGLDRIYPSSNRLLAKKMLDQGGLLTDFISQTNPDRENFPKRNRIVAGLSDAVLVIESAKKGGALITADIANSYNRDVFAVPGRVDDIYSEGCNYLIKTNRAVLVNNADDIKYCMGWDATQKPKLIQKKLFVNLSDTDKKLIRILEENQKIGIDRICILAQMPSSKVASALLNLEFEGMVECLPGKVFKLL
ncbi:MAG: DNA-processing protein DprA [Bacteroidetes bacterium]|nr:DNA-processing protein DprA [Bacteroidota bacterium]